MLWKVGACCTLSTTGTSGHIACRHRRSRCTGNHWCWPISATYNFAVVCAIVTIVAIVSIGGCRNLNIGGRCSYHRRRRRRRRRPIVNITIAAVLAQKFSEASRSAAGLAQLFLGSTSLPSDLQKWTSGAGCIWAAQLCHVTLSEFDIWCRLHLDNTTAARP